MSTKNKQDYRETYKVISDATTVTTLPESVGYDDGPAETKMGKLSSITISNRRLQDYLSILKRLCTNLYLIYDSRLEGCLPEY